jgi:predicted nucleotidyltransferase
MVELIREKLPEVQDLCRRHGVRQLQLFGSACEGGFDPQTSDIDLIVEMPGSDTTGYFGLHLALEKLFGRKVDLLEKSAIKNPYFIDAIRDSRETLYAA